MSPPHQLPYSCRTHTHTHNRQHFPSPFEECFASVFPYCCPSAFIHHQTRSLNVPPPPPPPPPPPSLPFDHLLLLLLLCALQSLQRMCLPSTSYQHRTAATTPAPLLRPPIVCHPLPLSQTDTAVPPWPACTSRSPVFPTPLPSKSNCQHCQVSSNPVGHRHCHFILPLPHLTLKSSRSADDNCVQPQQQLLLKSSVIGRPPRRRV